MSYPNPWVYRGEIFDDDHVGDYVAFVYLITNTVSGKQYIGKKTLISRKTKQVAGKKKKVKSPSDWKRYWGSNLLLQADIKTLGPEKFTREILYLCKNKGSANYLEAKEIFVREALEKENWYNEWCLCRISKHHIKLF